MKMAEPTWQERSFSNPYGDPDPYRDGASAADYPKAFGARAAGMVGDLGAAVRALSEKADDDNKAAEATGYLGKYMQSLFGEMEENAIESMSPTSKRDLQSTFTDPNFWSLNSFALKASNMAPDVVAAAVPSVIFPGVGAAVASAAAQGAVISSSSVVDEFYKMTDQLSDSELQAQSPYYADLRNKLPEERARSQYNDTLIGARPLIAGAVGAITNVFGPAGQAARAVGGGAATAVTGEIGEGIATRAAKGFAEGATAEAIQSGTEDYATQEGAVAGDLADNIDYGRVAESAAGGAVLGGVLGGGISAVGGARGRTSEETAIPETAPVNPPPSASGTSAVPGVSTTPNTTTAAVSTTPAAPPVTDAEVKAPAATVPKTDNVTVVEASAPDPAQTVAIATTQPKVTTPAAPVVEAPVVTPAPVNVSAPVQAPSPQVAPPVAEAAPITPPSPVTVPREVTPPVQEIPVETAAPVVEAPIPAPVAEARPEPALARPTPIEEVPAPRPEGPRILQDMTAKDNAADNARIIAKNIKEMEADPTEGTGRNRTKAEKEDRQKTRDGATTIAQKYVASDVEADIFSSKPDKKVAARRAILERAKSIANEANTMGLKIPKAWRDNTDEGGGYNGDTLLIMEARRLANTKNPEQKDYERFITRELDVRTGSIDQAIRERRAEGDAAMRKGGETMVEDVADATVDENANPEAEVIAAEEAGQTIRERRGEQDDRVPASIDKALDEALYTVPKAAAKPVAVETRKARKVVKPAEKPKAPNREEVIAEADALMTKAKRGLEALKRIKAEQAAKKAAQEVTPKVTPTVKERITLARKNTNTAPTPAQAQTGNYKKGRVSILGNEIAVENPKGSVRSNKDPNGPKWSVKMPVDYGYLVGTKGADGDPVDVFVGSDLDAPYVFVIDQVDPNTLAFDEHKVMLGFSNMRDAYEAYNRSYSDGLGMMRAAGMRRMTQTEFKAWLASDTKSRADLPQALADEARSFMIDDEFERQLMAATESDGVTSEGYVTDPITKKSAPYVAKRRADEILGDLDLSSLRGVPRVMAGTMRAQLSRLIGDVPVYVLDAYDLKNISDSIRAPLGYHVLAKDGSNTIFINSMLMNDRAKLRHTVIHEAVHAATVKAISTDRSIQESIYKVMAASSWSVRELSDAEVDASRYAYTNVYEFVAEAMSNPDFQNVLAKIEVSDKLARQFKLDVQERTLWGALLSAVRRALGLPKASYSMLEAAIRVSEMAMRPRSVEVDADARSFLIDGNTKPLTDRMKETLESITKRPDLAPTKGNPQLLGIRTLDNIARAADRYFGEKNPVRKVADLIEGQRVAAIKEFDRAAPIIQKLYDLERKYRGKSWQDFTSLVHDETMAGVYADRPLADQKHISKDGDRDSWQRQQYPELARRFAALPDDLKAARLEAMNHFTSKQNEIALKLIRNRIVTLFDTPDPEGLAKRIHEKTVTDADKALLGDAYDAIEAANVLSKIDGPYFPLMRRGNFVVKGTYAIPDPANATKIADNEFEFTNKGEASKFAAGQEGRPTIRTIYVDKVTGERTGTENGKTVRLTAQDLNAVPRYRVVVQNRHMEMFDTMSEARARVAELRAMGISVDDAVPRSFENYGIQSDALSVQMRRLSTVLDRKADARQFTPEQKKDLLETLNEVSLSMLGSTRIQSRSLPRTYVAGASKDLVRNTTEYSHAVGNYIAKLDYRPQMDAAMAEVSEATRANASDGLAAGRQAIYNELLRRVTSANPVVENKGWNAVSSRILSLSFIDKLMSPSYSVINATQPMMITAPYLAGHYGVGRAYAAMSKAYADIQVGKSLGEGLKATGVKLNPNSTIVPSDPVSLIQSRLKNAKERELIDVLVERGVIDTDSGLEVGKMVQDSKGIVGALDKGVGYVEGIARQFPKTVEAMNRTVASLAAYRLEMERSGDHARAIQFAQDTVNLTQFNYSSSNSSPLMNHPLLRLALQFKKYGIGMYQFLGEQSAIAIRNENPGDRARAIKSLSLTIGMHVLVAGAMGLPTEPIKMIVTAANGLGITDWSWADVETAQREAMADLFGKQFGEIVSRGVPRALGVDLSSRMGIDTLMGPFGEPRSNEAQDWKAYIWDSVAGAPAGLVADWAKGINDLAQGDVIRAAERLVPIKVFSDSIKAYRTFTEGTISEKTGKQTMSPYTVGEAALRAAGFQPSREAESYERSGAFYRGKDKQEGERSEFMRAWVEANGATRGRVWRDIRKWNSSQPVDVRLSLSDLRAYQKRIKSDMKNTKEGIRARRREQHLLDTADQTYNYLP
jgi:hypothetical protein